MLEPRRRAAHGQHPPRPTAILVGRVTPGFGLASVNLAAVAETICHRTGLRRMEPGTLNVRLEAPYRVAPCAEITCDEYYGWERLELQRCSVRGLRGVIVRPETHQWGNGHGPACVEIVAEVHLRTRLRLEDNELIAIVTGGCLPGWDAAGSDPAAVGAHRP